MIAGMPMCWWWVCAAGPGSGSGSLVCVYWGPVFWFGVYRGLGLANRKVIQCKQGKSNAKQRPSGFSRFSTGFPLVTMRLPGRDSKSKVITQLYSCVGPRAVAGIGPHRHGTGTAANPRVGVQCSNAPGNCFFSKSRTSW